jgi:RNA polymerase sigma-70 factor (ECF subfamily)
VTSWTSLRDLFSSVASTDNPAAQKTQHASDSLPLADDYMMQRIQSGDKQALALLYDRYARLILSVGLKILHDAGEAQELIQDVFLYVFQKSRDFDSSKSSLRSWVVQIAYSRAFNKREYLTLRGFYAHCQVDEIIDAAPADFSPEKLGEISELRALLRTALAALTQEQRTTLEMYFWEGYSLREISGHLQATVGNTRNHYYRGLEKLREVLKASLMHSGNGRK